MPKNAFTTMVVPPVKFGPPEGVYQCVTPGVYFYVFYKSLPASAVTNFPKVESFERFKKNREKVNIQKLMYGSLIVDEEVYQKFEGSLVPAGTAGILFPIEKIPEDYLNLSIVLQLQCQLGNKYTVTTQTADEGEGLPYNCYYKSLPDIVISGPEKIVSVDVQRDEEEEEEEEEEGLWDFNRERGVGGFNQLYAEAFNVIITKCVNQFKDGSLTDLTEVSVYCILLTNGCKEGYLALLSVDFQNRRCKVTVDRNVYKATDCFNIAFNLH